MGTGAIIFDMFGWHTMSTAFKMRSKLGNVAQLEKLEGTPTVPKELRKGQGSNIFLGGGGEPVVRGEFEAEMFNKMSAVAERKKYLGTGGAQEKLKSLV